MQPMRAAHPSNPDLLEGSETATPPSRSPLESMTVVKSEPPRDAGAHTDGDDDGDPPDPAESGAMPVRVNAALFGRGAPIVRAARSTPPSASEPSIRVNRDALGPLVVVTSADETGEDDVIRATGTRVRARPAALPRSSHAPVAGLVCAVVAIAGAVAFVLHVYR